MRLPSRGGSTATISTATAMSTRAAATTKPQYQQAPFDVLAEFFAVRLALPLPDDTAQRTAVQESILFPWCSIAVSQATLPFLLAVCRGLSRAFTCRRAWSTLSPTTATPLLRHLLCCRTYRQTSRPLFFIDADSTKRQTQEECRIKQGGPSSIALAAK